MDLIKKGFVEGWATKTEFEETLRANQESLAELKSVQRDKASVSSILSTLFRKPCACCEVCV